MCPPPTTAKLSSDLNSEELLFGVKWDSSFEAAIRIHFSSSTRPKTVAKRVKASLSFLGYRIKLSEAQKLTAFLYGYHSWFELQAAIGALPQSHDDEELPASHVAARRDYQVMRLVELGVPFNVAAYSVRMVGPTSRRGVPFSSLQDAQEFFEELRNLIGATGFRFYTREAGCSMIGWSFAESTRSPIVPILLVNRPSVVAQPI